MVRIRQRPLLLLMMMLSLASGGTTVGHGYISQTNEATAEVSLSLTGIASQTANYLTVLDSGSNAIASIDKDGGLTVAGTCECTGQKDNGAVYFHAYMSTMEGQTGMTAGDTIEFDTAVTNVGSGYDTGTNTFTAPYDGVYLLTSNVMSYCNGDVMATRFNKNSAEESIMGRAAAQYEIATMMYPAVLSQGDEITVNLHSDGTGYPCNAVKGSTDGFTYFAAYMITRT